MGIRPYTGKPQDIIETSKQDKESEEDYEPVRELTGEEDEEELAEDDAHDHSMERLDDDDLAYMQGPDA